MKADKKLIKEIGGFDTAFADGIYAVPPNPKEPRVKVRALWDYCKQKGVEPKDLSREEIEEFLEY
ncbi:hypothetical protein ACFYKT_18145 [Cytobacillus sp. FJAT-53684]|uniref:YozE SAM-like domain-containing protein n=1 Tax=Cytobacillus mangrovibacter TaxID=3299024 RepID=A0ABW6K259_9BACI